MTTFSEVDVRCAVCGELSRVAELTSSSSFGPPDLDLRPQGPARWALQFGVQRCRACGYCASSIGVAPPGAGEIVESVVYRGVRAGSRLPRLARDYFCAALVAEGASNDPESAARRFLKAAWACDDAGATAQARICRDRAAEVLERAIDAGELEPPREVAFAILADLRRRACRFDVALEACDQAQEALAESERGEDESGVAVVVAFIRELAESGDDECHSAAEAFAAEE
jgi:hypothetical protein